MNSPSRSAKTTAAQIIGESRLARIIARHAGGVFASVALTVPLLAQAGDWPMYSGAYDSHRFSPLTQITTANVARLRPAWVYQPPGSGSLESSISPPE